MDPVTQAYLERFGAEAPTNTPTSTDSSIPSTRNPLLTASAGESVNAQEQQMLQDFQHLGSGSFINKYGLDTYKSMLGQSNQAMNALRAERLASAPSLADVAGDSVKNIITGALSGVTDTGAFLAGMTHMNPLAKLLSKASEGIRDVGESLGSDSEKAKRALYQYQQQALKNRIDREYEEDIASGKGTTEAELARIGKQALSTVGNAFKTGQALELGTSGIGSVLTGGVVGKGIGLATKAARTAMPKIAKGIDAFAESNATAKKIAENTPWMASMGMQEGGGAYSQQLLEGLEMSLEDLMANSPQFVEAYTHYRQQGYGEQEAQQKAREDMAFAAARQAGLETAAAAYAANYMTAPLAKMTRGDKLLSKYIGEALSEPAEEFITEGLGQVAGNRATKEYLDNRQSIWEDVGQSAAEGAVGGFGMVAGRPAIGVGIATGQALWDNAPKTKEYIKNLKNKKVQEAQESKEEVKSTDDLTQQSDLNFEDNEEAPADTSSLNFDDSDNQESTPPDSSEPVEPPTPIDPTEPVDKQEPKDQQPSQDINTEEPPQEEEKPSDGFPITGRGAHHWKDPSVNEVKVGGEGYKYPEGKLTRPSTAPTQWNGQEISTIKDDRGNQAVGKFYSSNGSEYVYTKEGTTRKIKFVDSNTDGKDQGVQDWQDTYILDNEDPLYKLFAGTAFQDKQSRGELKNLRVDPTTRKIIFDDSETGETRPLMLSDVTPETETLDQDHDFTLPASRGEPKVGKTLVEITFGENGKIRGINPSGDIGYVENQQPPKKSEKPTRGTLEGLKAKDQVTPLDFAEVSKEIVETLRAVRRGELQPEDEKVTLAKDALALLDQHVQRVFANRASYKDKLTAEQVTEEAAALIYAANRSPQYLNLYLNYQDEESGTNYSLKPEHLEQIINTKYKNTAIDEDISKVAEQLGIPRYVDKASSKTLTGKDFLQSSKDANGKETTTFSLSNGKSKVPVKLVINPDGSGSIEGNGKKISITAEEKKSFSKSGNTNVIAFSRKKLGLDSSYKLVNEKDITKRDAERLINNEDTQLDVIKRIIKVLKERKQLLETNDEGNVEIRDEAVKSDQDAFRDTFGSTVGKLFKVTKRPSYLWQQDSPLEYVRKLFDGDGAFGEPETFNRVFGANKFANTNRLQEKLFSHMVDNAGNEYPSFAEQIRNALDPKGTLMRTIGDSIHNHLTFDKGMSEEGRKKLEEICKVAAVQFIANVAAYEHTLTAEELAKFGFTPRDQENIKQTGEGIYEAMAMQNFASLLRKFMGIAPDNQASYEETEKFLAQKALEVGEALLESGVLEQRKVVLDTIVGYDENGKPISKPKEATFLTASEDYSGSDRLFKAKSDILEAIINPHYKNQIHYEVPETKTNINHTSIAVSEIQKEAIEALNKAEHHINVPFYALMKQLGEDGITQLFGRETNEHTRLKMVGREYIHQKGQALSRSLAFEYLTNALDFSGKKPEDTVLYFSNVALKNGRIMQEGMATFQNNKLLRQALNIGPLTPKDLTDPDMFNAWRATLAQNLGVSINKKDQDKYLDSIDRAINYVEKHQDVFEGPNNTLVSRLRKFMDDFNEEFKDDGLSIDNFEGLNALVEINRYLQASPAERQKFITRVYAEIDGINDGPSNINSFFAPVVSYLSEDFIKSKVKTGMFFTDSTSQKMLDSDEENSKLYGTQGSDFHKEVAEQRIPRLILARVIATRKAAERAGVGATTTKAENIQRTAESFFNLCKAIGWIDAGCNIKKALAMDELPEDGSSPIKFTKDISKKLATIIPYGSAARGSTEQVVNLLLNGQYHQGLYGVITDKLYEMDPKKKLKPGEEYIPKFNGVSYRQLRESLINLLADPAKGYTSASPAEVRKCIKGLPEKFLTLAELHSPEWTADRRNPSKDIHKGKDTDDIRNLEVSAEGIEKMREALMEIIGEPAHTAVTETIGSKAMQGAKIPMAVGDIMSIGRMVMEAYMDKQAGGSINKLSGTERFLKTKQLQKVAPLFKFGHGAKIMAEKFRPTTGSEPLAKSKHLSYYSSLRPLANVGVSAGSLVIQGSGDATMIYGMARAGNVTWGAVYDGVYVPVGDGGKVGRIANKACANAQQEDLMRSINRSFAAYGKNLKKLLGDSIDLKKNGIESDRDATIFILRCALRGEYPDGTAMDASLAATFKDTAKALAKDIAMFTPESKFEESLISVTNKDGTSYPYKGKKNIFHGSTKKKDTVLKQEMDKIFDLLDVYEVNERINKEALEHIPQVFHHMSGFAGTYSKGHAFSEEKAKELLNKINSVSAEKFDNFSQLVAAYLNTVSNIIAEKERTTPLEDNFKGKGPTLRDFSESQMETWKKIRGIDNALSPARFLTPESYQMFQEALGTKAKLVQKDTKNPNKPYDPTKIDEETSIRKVKLELAKRGKQNSLIWAGVFNKLSKILPKAEDIKIHLLKPGEELPRLLNAEPNPSREAMYKNLNGVGHIYIFDKSGKKDLYDPKNMELLMHELVHVSMTSMLNAYFGKDPKFKFTAMQVDAIKNLESLIDQFEQKDWNAEGGVPEIIIGFKRILNKYKNDPAKRLDEALAYILSNQDLFEAIGKADVYTSEWKEQQSQLQRLIGRIKHYAQKLFKALFGIVTGSRLDTVDLEIAKNETTEKVKLMKFLELFGTNTYVLLDVESNLRDRDPKRLKKLLNSDLDNSDALKLVGEMPPFVDRARNVRNFIVRQFTRFWSPIGNRPSYDKRATHEEVQKWDNYKDAMARKLNDMGLKGDFLAETIVDLQLPQATLLEAGQKRDLTKIFNDIIDRLPEDFMVLDPKTATKEDYDNSKELHSYLTGSKKFLDTLPFSAQPRNLHGEFEPQAMFFTLAMNNPEFFNAIGKVLHKPGKQAPQVTIKSFKDSIDYLYKRIDNLLEKDIEAATVGDLMASQLQQHKEQMASEAKLNPIQKTLTVMDEGLMDAGIMILNGFLGLAGKKKIPQSAVDTLKEVPMNVRVGFGELARRFNNKFSHPLLATTIGELYGRLPSNTYIQSTLKRIKGFYDKIRKMNLEELPKLLTERFKHHKITVKDRKFFDRVLGQTDISVLDDLGLTEKCLTDKDALKQIIEVQEAELKAMAPDNFSRYKSKMKQLANFLSGSRESGQFLLTNATAIVELAGQSPIDNADPKLIKKVDQLTTLYCLEFLKDGDRTKLQEFYASDRDAMNHLIKTIAHVKEQEVKRIEETRKQETEEKTSRNKSYTYNAIKGWRPSGNQPKGHYILAEKAHKDKFISKGYRVLGEYKASNIDNSKEYVRMFTEWPLEKEFQEGVLQCITQTAWGYQIDKGTRGEANGARIYDADVAEHIFDNLSKENSPNGVIPIWSPDKEILGFERTIPPEDRALIEAHNDLFSGLAQWRVRQEREAIAGDVNKALIKEVYEDYHNATKEEKENEFIDVFQSKLQVFQAATKRLDRKTLERIQSKFGKGHFYLRKDVAYSVLGYYRLSLTDMWDGNFVLPRKVELVIAGALDKILGKRARYLLGHAENVWKGVVSWGRETIVIRSMIVPAINIASNLIMLNTALKIPMTDIWRLFKECYKDTEDFNKNFERLSRLKDERTSASPDRKAEIEKEIKKVQSLIENNPMYFLINAGEYSTISAQGRTFEELDITKQKFGDVIETVVDKMPKSLQTLGGNLLLTRNSELFQVMAKATNYGDWLAKGIGYRYLTELSESRKVKIHPEDARDLVSTLFVDYDQFTGRERDYLNNMGLTWFMTYKYRMIPAAILGMLTSPARVLLGTILASNLGSIGTPLTDNFFTKLFTGNIQYSLGLDMLWRSLTLHPLAWLLGLAK